MTQDSPPGRFACERRLRAQVTATTIALVLAPAALTVALSPREIRGEVAAALVPATALGLFAALAVAEIVSRHARARINELRETIALVEQRERERDSAQQELIARLQAERQLEREKMQFEAQLSDYEKYAALAQLALGAAHEINNPLLGMLSHLELELKTCSDPEQREEIEQCIQGAKRISSTISGLINYARPAPLLLSKVNLARLADDTFAFLEHQPLFRNIRLEKRIAPELPRVRVDANQLSQVMVNLLLNAAQAMPEGGTIVVAAEKVQFEEIIELRVSDDGIGIPADILPHVFEPFFTTKRGKGTGLGLSISQAYVRSHGGKITVDSLPGRGTTVRISLPIRHVQEAQEDAVEVVI